MRWWVAVFALGWSVPLEAGPVKRPAVDLQAMHEAMNASQAGDTAYPSAASYAHFLQARLSHHEGDHRSALDELRLALASDDSNPYLMTQLAEELARLSDLERAEGQLKRVIERYPDYPPAQLLMGRVLFEARKMTRARVHLQKAIHLRPNDPDAYLVLTQLCLDQGRVDDAIKVVDELGAQLPGEPIGYRRLGLALAERGDQAKAEKLLLRAVDCDPGDFEAWVALARIFEATARRARALEAYGRALERDAESREVLLAAGRLALRMERTADARAYFDQLLSLSHDPEQVVKVSFSYLAAQQLPAAVEVLDAARKTSDEPRLSFYAGLVHERLRAFAKAAEAFDEVPRQAGELFGEARLHRAMCLSSAGQHRAALELFKKAHDEQADLSGLDAAWARAWERAGQPKEAEALLLRAMAQGPAPEVLDAVTGFYERQNRLGDAVSLLSGALARSPRDLAAVRPGQHPRAPRRVAEGGGEDAAGAGGRPAEHRGDELHRLHAGRPRRRPRRGRAAGEEGAGQQARLGGLPRLHGLGVLQARRVRPGGGVPRARGGRVARRADPARAPRRRPGPRRAEGPGRRALRACAGAVEIQP